MIPRRLHGPKACPTGFTLVELMVATTLTLFVILALTTLFTNNSAARRQIDGAGQQIENGRYAMELIRDDVRLAGYYGEFVPTSTVSWRLPADPCDATLANLGWNAADTSVPVAISGYEGGDAAINALSCISNRVPNSDVLVVRRASTTALPAPPTAANTPFLQVSLQTPLCVTAEPPFVVDVVQATSPFTLHRKDKDCPTNSDSLSLVRQYLVHIYYVSACDDCKASDRIPTLKRVELRADGGVSKMIETSLAQGIADFRVEYGQDTNNDGAPEPDAYTKCGVGACTAANWANVMTVKVYLLTRNMEPTPGYADSKTYAMGLSGPINATSFDATERTYMHHVYASPIRVTGQSDLRELP